MSLIWDIVQSVERRAAVPLPKRSTTVHSRRELIFSAESESSSQQPASDSAADDKEQPGPAAAATTSELRHLDNTASAEKQTGRLDDLDRGAGASEKTAMQQQSPSLEMNERSVTDVQVSHASSQVEKQSDKKTRNTKNCVQNQQAFATDDSVISSGTKVEKLLASTGSDESRDATADDNNVKHCQ